MPETTYLIYEHRNKQDCNKGLGGGRAIKEGRDGYDTGTTPECLGVGCETPLVFKRKETIKDEFPEPSEQAEEYINELSNHERALLLGMSMESVRGSWVQLEQRLSIIGHLCEVGVGDQLSDGFIEEVEKTGKMLWRRERVDHLHPDGRAFRGDTDGRYGKLWQEVEQDIQIMKRLSEHIPNDLTWTPRKFQQIQDNE
jgi:hypothetical protein